jgi:hypothetical protein
MAIRSFAAIALLAASFAVTGASSEGPPQDSFVVHEWGTFTSVQGEDGVQFPWTSHVSTDLPSFVYDTGNKDSRHAILRMETPVIYFYSDAERVVDVRVSIPQGRVTEWYPWASRIGPHAVPDRMQTEVVRDSLIEWRGVTILPRDTADVSASTLIRTEGTGPADHYYAARATDANFLRISRPDGKGIEHERDLFYRGVLNIPGPLTTTVDANETELTLAADVHRPVGTLFVLTVRQGLMRYQPIEGLNAQGCAIVTLDAVPFTDLNATRAHAMRDVALALTQQGLYPKEAQAMVDTWKDQWFAEEGTRVLYLLPRAWTDQVLPLTMSPRPDRVVRVMVGRAEVITPSTIHAVKQQVMAYHTGDNEAKRQATEAAAKLNLRRFLSPAARLAIGTHPGEALQRDAFSFAYQANYLESHGATSSAAR